MKLGEKLQRLRKKSGLSQEQLAAQLNVSRQAVSKWELNETMPDTENVVQLSRLFCVSCDYLLQEEMVEPDASRHVPAAPGEPHPDEQNWTHNAFTLSLGLCSLGLTVAFMYFRLNGHTVRPLAAGFMIQILGVILFELSTLRMTCGRNTARLNFYSIACWLVPPLPMILAFGHIFDLSGWHVTPQRALICYFAVYVLIAVAATAILTLLNRQTVNK